MTEKRFTIHETGSTTALYAIERALADEPAITSIVEESGRHYSVPDRDDLPEWTALRIYCETGEDISVYLDALQDRLAARLGPELVNAVTFSVF